MESSPIFKLCSAEPVATILDFWSTKKKPNFLIEGNIWNSPTKKATTVHVCNNSIIYVVKRFFEILVNHKS